MFLRHPFHAPQRLFFLLLLLLLLTGTLPARAGDAPRVQIDPQVKRAEIRSALLKQTPLGSSPAHVFHFIQTQLLEKDAPLPKLRGHGATGASAEASDKRGTQSIQLDLADYPAANSLLLTLSPPLPLQESLLVQWAFDKQSRLIEIFLDRVEKENY